MPMKNIDATRSLTGVIDIALHRKIHEFFNDLVKNANTLYVTNNYFAIQEAIINAPEDLGVVRAAATFHHQRKYSVGYEYAVKHKEDTTNIEMFDPSDAVINLTIYVPLFGNIQAEARVNPTSQTVASNAIKITIDGAVGTLWFKSAMDILDKVKGANLLATPQHTETLEA